MWDVASSARVDAFAAISSTSAGRISRYYQRDACVIHPPVDDELLAAPLAQGAGQLLPLGGRRRAEQAARPRRSRRSASSAFRWSWPGPDRERSGCAGIAPANVSFFGWSSDQELIALYHGARALVFPGYDDFGLTPLEAAAVGRPTIAFAGGRRTGDRDSARR